MALITLRYEIKTGMQNPAAMIPIVNGVPIFFGELELIGMTAVSRNTTVLDAKTVTHTVVLQTTAEGDERFPTDEGKKSATRSLYKSTLELRLATQIVAQEPVIS